MNAIPGQHFRALTVDLSPADGVIFLLSSLNKLALIVVEGETVESEVRKATSYMTTNN